MQHFFHLLFNFRRRAVHVNAEMFLTAEGLCALNMQIETCSNLTGLKRNVFHFNEHCGAQVSSGFGEGWGVWGGGFGAARGD